MLRRGRTDTFRAMPLHPEHPSAGPLPSAQTLALVADALAWPLLLLQANGTLLLANLAARQLLRLGSPLQLSAQQRVAPCEPRRRTAFSQALQAAASSEGPRLLRWYGAAAGGRISATLTRLGGESPGMPGGPTLLLALCTEGAQRTDLGAFAALYGLSPAEARVLERLALGESSARAALALGVGAATVRSQTLSLRHKTGHASVAALLAELASLPPLALPLARLLAIPPTASGAASQGE